jgi:hypothetical protein
VESLEQAAHAFSKTLYERGAEAGGGGGEPGGDGAAGQTKSAGGDDAIDAEFEVKDK